MSTKGEKWAARALYKTLLGKGSNNQHNKKEAAQFADQYLYNDGIPTYTKLITIYQLTNICYSTTRILFHNNECYTIYIFTFSNCLKAKKCVSFLILKETCIARAQHNKGKCPFYRL